jgi:hypothetical protein
MLTGSVEVVVANASISTGSTGLFEGFRSALVREQGVRPIIFGLILSLEKVQS